MVGQYVVIGAGGFIGSTLTIKLLKEEKSVICVDTWFPENFIDQLLNHIDTRTNQAKVRIVKLDSYDVADPSEDIFNLPDGSDECDNIKGVFVLGAKSSSPDYKHSPMRAYKYTTDAFMLAMRISRAWDAPIVYASTSSIYGPTTGYTAVFKAREELAKGFTAETGISTIGCRFFSVYGEREIFKKPEYCNMITQMIEAARCGEPVEIYGDGTQSRDFTYVGDIVNGLWQSMCRCLGNHVNMKEDMDTYCYDTLLPISDVVDLGTGISYSFNDVVKIINIFLDSHDLPELEFKHVPNPLGKSYVQDTRTTGSQLLHTEQTIGWRAEVGLASGIYKLFTFYYYKLIGCDFE